MFIFKLKPNTYRYLKQFYTSFWFSSDERLCGRHISVIESSDDGLKSELMLPFSRSTVRKFYNP